MTRNSAPRGGAACFVNPNARCPECDAPVFYYANEYGSRVFFDDLGPPWPKHPCTDRSPPPRGRTNTKPPLTTRPRGLMQELTAAASAVGLYRGQRIRDGVSQEWTLLEIEFFFRQGFNNRVIARFIKAIDEIRAYFTFNSANEMISVGDIVSIRQSELSLWDGTKQRPRSYQVEFYADDSFSAPEGASAVVRAVK